MAIRDLIPWTRNAAPAFTREPSDPFLTLHREMNRLFDDVWRGSDGGRGPLAWPAVDVAERDKEYIITAELAGLDEKDIELVIEHDVLTIRGEKRQETNDEQRHLQECTYGRSNAAFSYRAKSTVIESRRPSKRASSKSRFPR
jgi:HSP20 family protein